MMNAEIRENTTAALLDTTASFGESCQKLHVVLRILVGYLAFYDADRGLTLKASPQLLPGWHIQAHCYPRA